MEVPLSSMLMGFSLINPPFLVPPIYGNPQMSLVPKIPSTIPRCSDVAFSHGCLGWNRVLQKTTPKIYRRRRRIAEWKRNSNRKKGNLFSIRTLLYDYVYSYI